MGGGEVLLEHSGGLDAVQGSLHTGGQRVRVEKRPLRDILPDFEDRGRGHEPWDAGSSLKLEKARTQITPGACPKNVALLTP